MELYSFFWVTSTGIDKHKNGVRFDSRSYIVILCVLFISSTYAILYRETLRHKKKIKDQQLPQEEVERSVKENKAQKKTVFVVGAVVLCFVPMALATLSFVAKVSIMYQASWVRTFGMLLAEQGNETVCISN